MAEVEKGFNVTSKTISSIFTVVSLLIIIYNGISLTNSIMYDVESTKTAILRIESTIERSEIRKAEADKELALKFKAYDDRLLDLVISIKELQTISNMKAKGDK